MTGRFDIEIALKRKRVLWMRNHQHPFTMISELLILEVTFDHLVVVHFDGDALRLYFLSLG